MKSHTTEITAKDLVRLVAGPLLIVVGLAAVMHGGARLRLLPAPRPALDTDRTVIIHQAEASRARGDAEVLLLGDSSCLMDVNARQAGDALGRRVLNLGLNSYLDLGAQALLLREFVAANPGRLRMVVLLMHPEALRRVGSEPYQLAILTNVLAGKDHFRSETLEGRIDCWSGAELFKGRLLSRAVPSPLSGSFGRFYGFSPDLERFMSARDGSAIDPGAEPAVGNAGYRLSSNLEKLSHVFRAAVPRGTTVLVGITPVPAKFAGSKYPALRDGMLRQWGGWLEADGLMVALPAVLPDELFTGVTHLKPAAVPGFTAIVADAARPHLR
jgi:hypothetical protein